MARIQILELPEGADDDRPPFALVIDQATEATAATLGEYEGQGPYDPMRRLLAVSLADQLGARAVLTFDETVDIPANDLSGYNGIPGDYATFTETVERTLGVDTNASVPDVAGWLLTACRELEKTKAASERLTRRVRDLHQPVESPYRSSPGMICAECSAYDESGSSTDNSPIAHPCATITALSEPAQPDGTTTE